ncbi:MAG: aminotransferase class V-fold PLP-dependent enzyme, partial [Bacteroidota bacterium]
KIQTWEVRPETMRLHLEDLEPLMNAHTRLVCVTHTSNVLGTLYPIREISDFVHEKGALIVVDGVAHAPHRLVDVQALDADFYVLSTYKVYGPHYGLLYGKKEHLLELPGINHSFIQENDIPYKFQPGNTNFELTYGMLGLTDYLQAAYAHHFDGEAPSLREQMVAVFDLIAEHEAQLSQRLLEFLLSKAGVRIVGEKDWHKELRVPTISFVAEGKRSDELVQQVDAANIGIRYGDFYAKKLIDSLGLRSYHGVVRVSMVHYNTLEEVDRLIEVLDRIL